jgi:predicted AlkP superfamily pyrophosphatase or phosphodiesterase
MAIKTVSISIIAGFIFSISGSAQQLKRIPPEKPKLIVHINIGQMRYDYLSRYWEKFGEDGFKKLITEGTYCKNTRLNYMYSDEGVGHATIATGTTPAYHGIVGKEWYLSLQDEIGKSAYDKDVSSIGGKYESGRYSPHHLMVSTVADEIKLATKFRSKSFAVALHPAPAIYSAGHSANAAYWFDFETGHFISSSYYIDSLPDWVNAFNEKQWPETYMEREWSLSNPPNSYSESLPDENKYEAGIKKQITFPYDLKKLNRKGWGNTDYGILEYVPFGDNLAKDFAIRLMVEEELGKDAITDYLSLNITSLQRLGKLYGPTSVEVQEAMLYFDKEIAHLLEFIDTEIGKENTMVVLTSDHGVAYSPAYLQDHKMAAGYFKANSALSLLKSYMNAIYGKGDWIKLYNQQQIYLNRTLIEDANLQLSTVQYEVAQFMLQFSGVANTITSALMQASNFNQGIFHTMQNSFNQKRSADVFLHLEANWVEGENGITDHSSAYTYDTHLPLIWYGWKIKRNTITDKVSLVDIAPTICNLLDITPPNASTGVPIKDITR